MLFFKMWIKKWFPCGLCTGDFQSRFLTLSVFIVVMGCSEVVSEKTGSPGAARKFIVHETMIEELALGDREHACDYTEVLPQLLEQIGSDADIYPSENYYYFSFKRAGLLFSGSLRLSSDRRDDGELDYVCYESYRPWAQTGERINIYKRLSADDGVSVNKLSARSYLVKYGDAQTRFSLHKLDHTTPGSRLLQSEVRVGRTLDDSASVFELIYNSKLNNFYFLLDLNQGAPEKLVGIAPNTVVSTRTGFVYYHAPNQQRYVLVAVNQQEVSVNSSYDGPFDQLPENDYSEIGFWDYVYKTNPKMAGKHTPGGTVNAKGMIFALKPYRLYDQIGDMTFVETCVQDSKSEIDRIRCMIWGN